MILGRPLHSLTAGLLLLTSLAASAEGVFGIRAADISHDGDWYMLDAEIEYVFSETALEALHNGVPLTIITEASVREPREWLWSSEVAATRLRQLLRYQALTKSYDLIDLGTRERRSYWTLQAATDAMGTLKGIGLDNKSDATGNTLSGRIKTWLDIESLPVPLRPAAWVSPSWHHDSGEQEWSLSEPLRNKTE